jgi:DNA gyrase subunit A
MPASRADQIPVDHGRIEDVDVSIEMQGSFLEYAYSVIYSRALPDARDGLKPVQRRILFQMADMGLRPDRGHVKSARVVGEVMGKLHPHGDAPIDGHGNFGSLDDGPAAPRYTEARLAPAALALTENLDEDVVDFIPNYDGQFQQPEVLPAAFPNLLVNGTTGIAVGMATNMAPHNLNEVVAAAIHLLEHPEATVEELMEFVPGPDLPSGGIIVGLDGIKDAYAKGRGTFRTRAKVSIESLGPRRTGLVVTELPYLVGPERVIEKIKDAVQAKKLQGIADVTDLTDRHHGLRLVIGIKTGFDPDAVLAHLYRLTPLEDSFSINNVALVGGQPQTLGLKELLRVYLDHRIAVVTRRSAFRLARRRERLHLVEGLLIAILDIDEVIQVIRTSDDSEQARARLQEVFDLSPLQAEYILELRLRRLTKFSRIELEAERDTLKAEIAQLEELLASDALLRAQVAKELDAAAETHGSPRRTLLLDGGPVQPRSRAAAATADLQIADEPCRVFLSSTGRMVRAALSPEADGGGIVTPTRRAKHDAIRSSVDTTTRGDIGAVTSAGRLVRFSPVDVPAVPGNSVQLAAGTRADQYLGLHNDEHVVALVALTDDPPIALGTAQGVVKRVTASEIANKHDVEIIALKPGDSVVGAASAPDDAELVFLTSDAQLLRFGADAVRPQGRAAGGMAGIRVTSGERAIWFGVVPADQEDTVVVTLAGATTTLAGTDPGTGKVSSFEEFPPKGRATGGVRAQRFLKGEDTLRLGWVGADPRAVGADGSVRGLPAPGAKRDASGTPLDGVVTAIGTVVR